MGRRAVVVLSLAVMVYGCAHGGPRASDLQTAQLRAALRAVYSAVARGDEAAYRRQVLIAPDDAYSDALTATMFESVRLHQDVERQLRHRQPMPATTTATTSSVEAPLGAVDYRTSAKRVMPEIDQWTFTVRGDRASIDALQDRPDAPILQRRNKQWRLVPRPWDTPADSATYRQAVLAERAVQGVLAAARRWVAEGGATSVAEVNDYIRRLMEQATTRAVSENTRR